MLFAAGETVVLHQRTVTGRDSLGNDVYTTVDTTITGCAYNPGTSVEVVQGQDMLTVQPVVTIPVEKLPAGVDVTAVDRVTVRGTTFEVDGSPNQPRNPFTGWQPGIVIKLKAVTG